MTEEINQDLTTIEVSLINGESPSYIEVSWQNDFVYILVSKPEYKSVPISERQKIIKDLLEYDIPYLFEKYSVIIDILDENELTNLMKMYDT